VSVANAGALGRPRRSVPPFGGFCDTRKVFVKRYKKTAIAGLSILVVISGLRLLSARLPVKLEGLAWNNIERCAENQKMLYQSIEHYRQENGKLPDQDFQIRGGRASDTWKCPACERGYTLHLENYGNPRAVVIADEQNGHSTTFMWWFRGLHPHVQTMGDGTIHLFKGGKILTMVGSKKRT
jgi:hypothetical protein